MRQNCDILAKRERDWREKEREGYEKMRHRWERERYEER